ncbi:MAG TPA: hypothetical protein VGF99_05965, partial [Myxococcota bacterium]
PPKEAIVFRDKERVIVDLARLASWARAEEAKKAAAPAAVEGAAVEGAAVDDAAVEGAPLKGAVLEEPAKDSAVEGAVERAKGSKGATTVVPAGTIDPQKTRMPRLEHLRGRLRPKSKELLLPPTKP